MTCDTALSAVNVTMMACLGGLDECREDEGLDELMINTAERYLYKDLFNFVTAGNAARHDGIRFPICSKQSAILVNEYEQ